MSSNGHASPSAPVKKVSLSFNNNELGGGARRSFSREGSFLGNSNATSAAESSFIPISPSPFSKQAEIIRGGRKSPEPFTYPAETKPIYPETKSSYPEAKPPAPAEDEPLELHVEERKRQHALAQEHLKVEPVEASVLRHVQYTLARRHQPLTAPDLYLATALSVRERLIERWTDTQSYYTTKDPKRVCYLSLEYLVGRCLQNTIHNLGVENEYTRGIAALGYELEDLAAEEHDPALGNGGLGRLASCFLDSMATLNYPAWGYGLRYRYGMFEQRIEGGQQREVPDYWLQGHTNPWEVQRLDISYPVRFYGHVHAVRQGRNLRYQWEGGEIVKAQAFDSPIPGYRTRNTNTMRLWSSCAWDEFDLNAFNAGQLAAASEARMRAESISAVLYPNDHTDAGKELRLKQQFFFVSATLQDVVRRLKRSRRPLAELPDKVAIQLNDTHPTIAIPELMRIMLDLEGLEWAEAWSISTRTFAYTNHTILPEALERWPVPLLERLLPRHMQIIYEINHRHLQEVEARWPHDTERLAALSIIEESFPKMVRMAVLAIVGSHSVNGVAEIHTGLVRTRLFPQLADMWPERFNNKTNGVTPRRWLLLANPSLAALLTKWLGGQGWVTDIDRLRILKAHAANPDLQQEWAASKRVNKLRLAEYIEQHCGVQVSADALFDMHVKRIHEYKRQLLNILSVVHRYNVIKAAPPEERARMVPHVKVFAGKAAAGYYLAKRVIHLITSVAAVVNGDPDVGPLLKVVFLANYNVSLAEVIIPASDISQHISTAGMEASGTSNMKFALNGGLILGTMDGANIEIADAIGRHNMFVFGAAAEDTDGLRREMAYQPPPTDERLQQVYSCIEAGAFGPASDFRAILDSLQHGNDFYLLAHDFPSYLEAQAEVDRVFVNKADWIHRSIVSASCMGRFSSDRTISEYAANIWHLEAVPCPE